MHLCGTSDLDAGFADHFLVATANCPLGNPGTESTGVSVLNRPKPAGLGLGEACPGASIFIHIHFLYKKYLYKNTSSFSYLFIFLPPVTQKSCVTIIFLLDLEREQSFTPSNAMEGRKIFEGFLYIRGRTWLPRSYFNFRPLWKPRFFTLTPLAYWLQRTCSRATLRAHLSPRFSSLIAQQVNLM